jgi:hypothetical protein
MPPIDGVQHFDSILQHSVNLLPRDRPGSPLFSQSSTACRTGYVREVCSPRLSSSCSDRSASATSVLVLPDTLRRTRLPSAPYPRLTTPRQRPVQRL